MTLHPRKKQLLILGFLGLLYGAPAFAQRDIDVYESDRRYCASGRSGVSFDRCMWKLQNDRERDARRDYREDRRPQWREPPPPPPPPYAREWEPQPERPKLSDMQQRALDNCAMLLPRDQPRCRATVWSTVR